MLLVTVVNVDKGIYLAVKPGNPLLRRGWEAGITYLVMLLYAVQTSVFQIIQDTVLYS